MANIKHDKLSLAAIPLDTVLNFLDVLETDPITRDRSLVPILSFL
jgi:hypothetical protein